MPTPPKIDLDRGSGVRLLPIDFFDVLNHRFLPVLSLTYCASIAGISMKHGHSVFSFLFDSYAYDMALWVALWVSVPAIFWIVIRNSMLYAGYADVWYKAIAGLMILTLIISFVLFPESEIGGGMRIFLITIIPIFFIQYYFFVRGGLPAMAAWPLNVAGIVMLLYGQIVL